MKIEATKYLIRPFAILFLFAMFLVQDYVSATHVGFNPLSRFYLLPFLCICMIEVLNQTTYWLAKRSEERAAKIKTICFWILIICYFTSDIYIRLHGSVNGEWLFSKKMSAMFLLLVLSVVLPFYGSCPHFRFLVLYGKLEWIKRRK